MACFGFVQSCVQKASSLCVAYQYKGWRWCWLERYILTPSRAHVCAASARCCNGVTGSSNILASFGPSTVPPKYTVMCPNSRNPENGSAGDRNLNHEGVIVP